MSSACAPLFISENDMRKSFASFVLALAFATSCGSSSDVGSQSSPSEDAGRSCDATIRLLDFELDPAELETTSGAFELCVENVGKTPHDLAVRSADGRDLAMTPTLSQGEQSRLSLTVTAGNYPIYCAEPGHESLGMHGMLTVR
jgi:plastocyanin